MTNRLAASPEERPVRIGINAHLLSDDPGYRRAGIHQYIAQVLAHLPPLAPGGQYIVYARRAAMPERSQTLELRNSRWPTEKRIVRILWEQTAWPLLAILHRITLLHSMAFVTPLLARGPVAVTIFDLSFLHYPESFPRLQRWYLLRQTALSCRRARRIITISESSRQDVHRYFGVPLARIDVVPPGVDPQFSPRSPEEIAAFRQREQLPQQVVLHVGTLQPRKNILLLLEALAALARPQVLLALVGGKGWHYGRIFARVMELGLEQQVRFVGYVADADLPLWYNAASVLAFPSAYEGFGMPIVEAMACGTPVVAARSSSLPEAGGEAAVYFHPGNVEELQALIASILDDVELAGAMRRKGLEQATRFSWRQAGQETAAVYRRILADS